MNQGDIKKGYYPSELNAENFHYYIPRRAILDYLKSRKHLFRGKFIDLGCGFMPYRELFEGRVDKYIPVDVENSEIYSGGDYVFWDAENIPSRDNEIDVLLSTELLEHMSNPEDIAREVFRVLKPGGHWIGTVPFLWPIHEAPHDRNRFTSFTLSEILTNAGFEIEDFSALGGLNASLAQMLSIWLHRRQPAEQEENLFNRIQKKIILTWISKLINSDENKIDVFSNDAMYTGIGWTVRKPL